MSHFIHQTDIFHPHGDPDDHWDLATVFALSAQNSLQLQGVMLDYPPPHRVGDPATCALAQLSVLTGINGIPFTIGSPHPMRHRHDAQQDRNSAARSAANWLCTILEQSSEPIVVNIVGACTDVALAGLLRPDLFEKKCRAVYLNAGAANPGVSGRLEYNVKLNPHAYAAIFDLPCPVYWCPCWHQTEVHEIGEHGTWYSFQQETVFQALSEPMLNYFLYMLSRSDEPKYLRYLNEPVDPDLRRKFGEMRRNMWSTAAIFDAAGLTVDRQQGLMPKDQATAPIFSFAPIKISCTDTGETNWEQVQTKTNRYLFTLHQPDSYAAAFSHAIAELLQPIGRL